jgi:ABC-2 type transport system ATP-binding protein
MTKERSAVDVHGLTKRYHAGERPAVKSLDMRIGAGEIFGFVGPNGAGKTTTIKMLMGMVPPTSGGGTIFGMDIIKDTVMIRRRVGFMSGEVKLYNNLTGRELIDLTQRLHNGGDTELLSRLLATFDDVPLDRRIKTYSAGQKQQTALIAALAHQSDLLVLDEPTKGLDPSRKTQFLEVIQERGRNGAAVIISSHVLSEIDSICTRVGFIRNGMLLREEEIESVRGKLANAIVVTFNEAVDKEQLSRIDGVRGVHRRGGEFVLRVDGDGRNVLKKLVEMPVHSLRYNASSLDDLYEQLYLQQQREGQS